MPGGNGMGPMGMGPMSGRGAGYCAGFAAPGYMNAAGGRGRGMGRGMGRGAGMGMGRGMGRGGSFGFGRGAWGYGRGAAAWANDEWAATPPSREQQLELLQRQAEFAEGELEEIRSRIAALQKTE